MNKDEMESARAALLDAENPGNTLDVRVGGLVRAMKLVLPSLDDDKNYGGDQLAEIARYMRERK